MRIVSLASLVLVSSATLLGAQSAAPPAPPPSQAPSFQQIGLLVYPAKGQSPEQQKADETACAQWAVSQTGIQPGTSGVDPKAAGEAAQQQAASATTGAAVGGAARGAAGGAIIGAISGDAGEGAAIGAVAGAIGGRRAKRQAEASAKQQGEQHANAQNQAMLDHYKKAAATCMQGRGYTAN